VRIAARQISVQSFDASPAISLTSSKLAPGLRPMTDAGLRLGL